jgi:Cu/Ag efflux protein CusF
MPKLLAPLLMIFLSAGTLAQAQVGPGHGRGGRNRPSPSGGSSPTAAPQSAPTPPPTPLNQIEIVGVVRAIDPAAKRITIDYEAVEALDWPRGSMPFAVYRAALLDNVTVGEKVRFKLDAQQITELRPF